MREFHGRAIGFMGNIVENLRPTPILLTKQRVWTWKKVNIINDPVAMTAFGGNPDKENKFWTPTGDGIDETFLLPFIHIPHILAAFVLEQPHMCWEIYEEIAWLVGLDNKLTDKHFKLLISWFVTAAHGKDRKSILNMEMLAAATPAPSFHKWANIWLGCTMGREESKSPVPTMGAPPTQGQPPTYKTAVVTTSIVQGITQGQHPQRATEQTLQEATQKSEKGQRYDEYRVVALQGWYGTAGIPQIWSQFEATKKVDTHCLNIELDIQMWAGRQGIILDHDVVLAKGNINDITGLHPNPGTCTATHKFDECIVSVLACCP